MSITDGQAALVNHLVTMDSPPNVVMPDDPESAGLPRYVVQAIGGAQRTMGVGGGTASFPEISVRVETKEGGYATENEALVKKIVDRFHVAARFDGIEIMEAPRVTPPLPPSDGVYAVPVIIRGRYTF